MPMIEAFSNRELATGIWAFLLFAFLIFSSDKGRKALVRLVKLLVSKPIAVTFLILVTYVAGDVWLLHAVGIWDRTLTKDTCVWFLFSAFATFLKNIPGAENRQLAFDKLVMEAFSGLVVFEFVVNFYTFSLPTELILVPVVIFVAVAAYMAKKTPEYAPAAKVLGFLLGTFGIYILFHTIKAARVDPAIFSISSAKQLLVPSLLTVLFIPALYIFALYSIYEMTFLRISFATKEHPDWGRYTKWRTVKIGHVRLHKTKRLAKVIARNIWRANSLQAIQDIFSNFSNPPTIKLGDRVKLKTTGEVATVTTVNADFAVVKFSDGDEETWLGDLELVPDHADTK